MGKWQQYKDLPAGQLVGIGRLQYKVSPDVQVGEGGGGRLRAAVRLTGRTANAKAETPKERKSVIAERCVGITR